MHGVGIQRYLGKTLMDENSLEKDNSVTEVGSSLAVFELADTMFIQKTEVKCNS